MIARRATWALAALVTLQACASATAPDREPLAIDYLATSRSTYLRFELEDTSVRVTSFDDTSGRCRAWLREEPCWTNEKMRTNAMTISERELDDLRTLIARSKLESLAAAYGATKPGQRDYVEKLVVRRGRTTKEVVYERARDTPPPPAAFEKIRDRLLELGRVHG